MPAARGITGWGRRPVVRGVEIVSEDLAAATLEASATRGLGRSYGDASLPRREGAAVACSRAADRILAFDAATGVVRAEAGLSLARLDVIALGRGLACPVVPGTEQVTLGGMVACDVHGKNQHQAGCFGDHVRSLRLRLGDGSIVDADAVHEPDLFRATLGGMGLTGHLLEVELQLERVPSPWIRAEVDRVRGLDELLGRLRTGSRDWPFTVAWIDGLAREPEGARGLVFRGRWEAPGAAPRLVPRRTRALGVPWDAPSWLLGRPLVRAFNLVYESVTGRRRSGLVPPQRFFFPLDAVGGWNRLYGRRGFTQHQCVLPASAPEAPRLLLGAAARAAAPSFLTVIKDFGRPGPGLLSFAMAGTTVAVDLPFDGTHTQTTVDALNEVVLAAGGRVYLAKDSLTRPDHFRAMEPRLEAFQALRRTWDPAGRIATALSVRLFGDAP